uniref:Uncharacterized protein n=1 Tax=Gopherus agassizii TaxID=38772 RepID=A0A452HM10_9SAUR
MVRVTSPLDFIPNSSSLLLSRVKISPLYSQFYCYDPVVGSVKAAESPVWSCGELSLQKGEHRGAVLSLGFFCFAIVFCALIQAAFWRYTNNSEVSVFLLRNTKNQSPDGDPIAVTASLSCLLLFLPLTAGAVLLQGKQGVYGMILTSFLWFSIHFSNNLDRRGKYIFRET